VQKYFGRALKEQNRLRLERLAARFGHRVRAVQAPDDAAFLAAFAELRERVLRPHMEEVAAELRKAGHESRVVLDEGPDRPSIELSLGLRGGKGGRNVVGFAVIHWVDHPLQILAYLEPHPPPFDIERFGGAEEITPDRVEQLLVDAVEHLLAVNAP
jgi:hypothetical protein